MCMCVYTWVPQETTGNVGFLELELQVFVICPDVGCWNLNSFLTEQAISPVPWVGGVGISKDPFNLVV